MPSEYLQVGWALWAAPSANIRNVLLMPSRYAIFTRYLRQAFPANPQVGICLAGENAFCADGNALPGFLNGADEPLSGVLAETPLTFLITGLQAELRKLRPLPRLAPRTAPVDTRQASPCHPRFCRAS